MPTNLDIALLRTVAEVARCGSMTMAANRLHMTQGAVSQQIKRLEALFGGEIFVRLQQGVRLSARGERVLDKIRPLLAHHDGVLLSLLAEPPAGVVRLGVPHDLVGTHLPPLLKSFAEQHPNIAVALVFGSSVELRTDFDKGRVDVALIEEHNEALDGEVMSVELPVWVGAPGGAAWSKRPLPLCLVSATCTFRPPTLAALRHAAIDWTESASYPSVEATFATVKADLAVTVWLASLVPSALQILGPDSGLPAIPLIAITLHARAAGAVAGATELAKCIRTQYAPAA